jgi:hypothetical protein
MQLTLRPVCRGNWAPVVVQIKPGRNSPLPLYVAKGDRVELGGQRYRVVEVLT